MDDLVAFLKAALDEDERLAQRALDEQAPDEERETRYPYPERLARCMHDARHGPARVLREVAAKRAIIGTVRSVLGNEPLTATWLLLALAAVYSDHTDYRPEWAPQ